MNAALSKELEEVARGRNFTAGMRSISGGSVEDVNLFIDGLNIYLKGGMTLNGLQYEFIVNPTHVTALFKAELRALPEVRRIKK